jgi:hypothetical protein
MRTDDLPTDSVEMVRAIRQRHYEETKGMTLQERFEHQCKKVAEYELYRKTINPANYDFPFLKRKT